MKNVGHLAMYTIALTVQSPLFIGSGQKISKKEYLYDTKKNELMMIDLKKLATFLDKKGLMTQYQTFMLDEANKNIYTFFRNYKIQPQDYRQFEDYRINMAGENIQGENTLRDVSLFLKDAQGNPYIPGSSIKGALRTAILTYLIYGKEQKQEQKREARNREWQQEVKCCRNSQDIKKRLAQTTRSYEAQWLNRLNLPETKVADMVNSVMRGIAVSDSTPMEKAQLMLVQKIDRSVKGREQALPLFRECLRPATRCQFTITIDMRIAEQTGWTMQNILKAVKLFQQWQQKYFHTKFPGMVQTPEQKDEYILWLGGGVGFINKTINQPSLGTKHALEYNADLLQKLFRNGNHEKDKEIGISPHMQKLAIYQGKRYYMGQCQLEVQEQ